MNLKMKKVIAWVLVCLCVYGSMPKEMVKAASTGSIYYVPKGQQGRYTGNLDEALQSCSSRGGEIVLEKDVHYDFPDFIYYDTINKDTTLVVSNGVTLTIGKKRIADEWNFTASRWNSRFGKIGGDFIWFRKRSGVRWTCD